jgi:tight adherence protein C
MLVLFAALVGIAILSLAWGVTAKPSPGRMNLFSGLVPAGPAEAPPRSSFLNSFGQLTRKVLPSALIKGLNDRLVQAGHPKGIDLPKLLGIKAGLLVVLFLFPTFLGQPLLGLIFGVVGFFVPDYWVLTERDKRQAAMRDSAADTIDQLTIVVEAGLGFDAALDRVANTSEGPLALELQRTAEDMRSGIPRDQALKGLADRTQIPEIRQLVTALVQAQRHGTPLASTLRVQSAELRDKRTQRIEEKAAKLATKMVAPIVICFLPVFFIVILVPALATLADALG